MEHISPYRTLPEDKTGGPAPAGGEGDTRRSSRSPLVIFARHPATAPASVHPRLLAGLRASLRVRDLLDAGYAHGSVTHRQEVIPQDGRKPRLAVEHVR
jgi:hypothetical protein